MALSAGALGVGAGISSAQAGPLWSLETGNKVLPVHTVGTACTLQQYADYTLARTKWGTVIGCGGYLLHNKPAAHWTYLWFKNDDSRDVWASDGWLYPGGERPSIYTGTRPTT